MIPGKKAGGLHVRHVPIRPTRQDIERFERRIHRPHPFEKGGGAGCWLWTGRADTQGYGRATAGGRVVYAHRFAWFLAYGTPPLGYTLDHVCRNRICVRPTHLRVLSVGDNSLAGDNPAARNAKKRACLNRHPFSEKNTYITKKGYRYCRKCHAARQLARYYRQRRAKKKAS